MARDLYARGGVALEGLEVYRDFLVVSERECGLGHLRVIDRASGRGQRIAQPDPIYDINLAALPMWDETTVRFAYSTLAQPTQVVEYSVADGARRVRLSDRFPGFDPDAYEVRREFAQAKDGTRIPISILMRKGTQPTGEVPLLINGYGAYGSTEDLFFRPDVISLVDRGWMFAIAHVRGGSELGRDWYEQGRLAQKMNTFTDFIASVEHIIQLGYTQPKHVYAEGRSAGGLLMGAVVNLRPDLFNGVIAGVPFVDVVTTMLDETLPLTTGEYREWGDPREEEAYRRMLSYSPYDNVRAQNYPHMLVTAGYHDSQVQYFEPAKWVARLRARKTDDNLLLLKTNMTAGHNASTGITAQLKDVAEQYAFLLMLEARTHR